MNHLLVQKGRFLIVVALIVLVLPLMNITSTFSFAAPPTGAAKVNIPSFPITLNGQSINNESRQYPLILYKDITYIPMTYNDSRFLGLASQFDGKSGLEVTLFDGSWPYDPGVSKTKNIGTYDSAIATFPIKVNGKTIENSKETYPLLLFRDITYFPLTWRFAVDEFKWQYTFTAKDGLNISNNVSDKGGAVTPDNNVSVTKAAVSHGQTKDGKLLTTIRVPKVTGANRTLISGAATISGNQVYYQGNDGIIYYAPAANPAMAKKIYQLPKDLYATDDKTYVSADLSVENGNVILSYRDSSVLTGVDYQILLKENGTFEKISTISNQGYIELFGTTKVCVSKFQSPYKGNLSILYAGEKEAKSIGNPDYYYGWNTKDCLEMIGDDLYVLANTTDGQTWYLHKVNVKTNVTTKVSNMPMNYFEIDGSYIYFTNNENQLQRMSINGQNTQMLNITGGTIANIHAQQGYIIYTLNNASGSYLKTTVLNANGQISLDTSEKIISVFVDKSGNIQCVAN